MKMSEVLHSYRVAKVSGAFRAYDGKDYPINMR